MKTVVGRMVLVVLVAVLGSAMVFWGCSKKSPTGSNTSGGKLYIASYPDSATVILDGATQSGRTPLTLQNVSAAQHVVICTRGNFSAVDTVVVHTGRTTPDTAFCWIPGKVVITSQPTSGLVRFKGWLGMTGGGSVGVWSAPSDTYQVTCSTSTAGYFKAIDTFRIWADSTAKNYILPPCADSTIVWARDSATGNWQRGGPFNKVDIIEVDYYLAHDPPVYLPLWIQLVFNNNPVLNDTFTIPDTMTLVPIGLTYGGYCFPPGTYSQPTRWVVTPHGFLLSNPSWTISSDFLGGLFEPGRIRASVRRLSGGHPF